MTTESPPATAPPQPLLEVREMSKRFPVKLGMFKTGYISAVDGVSFSVSRGTTLGIVGESGCGKSTTARVILGLTGADSGDILFEGNSVRFLARSGSFYAGGKRKLLRREMQMVFQDPYSSLNPRASIGDIIAFPMRVQGMRGKEIKERRAMLLERVGLHPNHAAYYPYQMSGGQRQRVNIARALALQPKLVICDEAVSALDKSVQAQVLNLLKDLQQQFGLTYIFISHDLNVVEYMSDRVAVMYLGQVVETCTSDELYQNPMHPYTKALLSAIPKMDPDRRLTPLAIDGEIPSPLNPPSGCRFRTRCPMVMDVCAKVRPPLTEPEPGHFVACHLFPGGAATLTPQREHRLDVIQPAGVGD
jgi:oligopeptide/dipeptide ABC transporter ATP-binding protein